jgi:hypothetical protein
MDEDQELIDDLKLFLEVDEEVLMLLFVVLVWLIAFC